MKHGQFKSLAHATVEPVPHQHWGNCVTASAGASKRWTCLPKTARSRARMHASIHHVRGLRLVGAVPDSRGDDAARTVEGGDGDGFQF
jgi:hypothetical protein